MKKWFLSSLAIFVCSVTLTSGVYADVDNTPGVNNTRAQMMKEEMNQNLYRGSNNNPGNPSTALPSYRLVTNGESTTNYNRTTDGNMNMGTRINTNNMNMGTRTNMNRSINQNLNNVNTQIDQVNRSINNNMDANRGLRYVNTPNYVRTAVDTNNNDDADYGWLGLFGLLGLLGLRRRKDR